MNVLLLVGGLAVLILGADWLVRGASRIAAGVGIPPLVVGLTVVAFGTSSPEMAVSVASALDGRADLAVGNVVGSNILNVLLILGLSAIIAPLAVKAQLVRLEVPVMVGLSALAYLMSLDRDISRLESAILVAGIMAYVTVQIRLARREPSATPAALKGGVTRGWVRDGFLTLSGLALLVVGSGWLVEGAVAVARSLGMSELVIGLTLVALGTSLPELATSVTATLKGELDIAVGNVVGSNIFNILGVLGVAGIVSPEGLAVARSVVAFDLPVMIAVAVACLPVFFSGRTIARWEGVLFLAYYVAYTAYVVLASEQHEVAPLLGGVMLQFVIPLTVVTLGVVFLTGLRRRKGTDPPEGGG